LILPNYGNTLGAERLTSAAAAAEAAGFAQAGSRIT
jgi:hypothetical protein